MLSESLTTYLVIAVLLLALGLFGMVRHKTFIGMLISSEFILGGACLNFMAFNRFVAPNPAVGQIFTLFIIGLAAAEAAVVVSLVLMVYHQYRSIDPGKIRDLRH